MPAFALGRAARARLSLSELGTGFRAGRAFSGWCRRIEIIIEQSGLHRRPATGPEPEHAHDPNASLLREGKHIALTDGMRSLCDPIAIHPQRARSSDLASQAARFEKPRMPEPLIYSEPFGRLGRCRQFFFSC